MSEEAKAPDLTEWPLIARPHIERAFLWRQAALRLREVGEEEGALLMEREAKRHDEAAQKWILLQEEPPPVEGGG